MGGSGDAGVNARGGRGEGRGLAQLPRLADPPSPSHQALSLSSLSLSFSFTFPSFSSHPPCIALVILLQTEDGEKAKYNQNRPARGSSHMSMNLHPRFRSTTVTIRGISPFPLLSSLSYFIYFVMPPCFQILRAIPVIRQTTIFRNKILVIRCIL